MRSEGSQAADLISDALCEAVAGLGPLMQTADERRRLAGTRPYRATEADLKESLRSLAVSRASNLGLRLADTEWRISPADWPRVGPVDLVLATPAEIESRRRVTAFVELKWAVHDRLWHVAWDLMKSALVCRVGLAERAFCVVGTLESERATRYGSLLESKCRDMREFVSTFHDALKPFCFAEDGREHPTGPYCVPAHMNTAVRCEQPLHVGDMPWTVTVLEVTAPGNEWLQLDDRCRPVPADRFGDPG